MAVAHIHLLLDVNKEHGELIAECPSCGAATIETLRSAWSKKFIAGECGIVMEIDPEHLRQLRVMAAEYQRTIDELIGSN